jgi:lipopolysaccharide biosynthesis glycosyltransferase
MTKKIAIVTGSDKKYFPFLKNLILSLHKTKSLDFCDLCVLEVDNRSEYLDEIDKLINVRKKAFFSLKLLFKERENWYKLLTERPFIKDYFPGYQKYIWLDADTEVFDSEAIKNLAEATEKNDLAISPEVNESYVFKNTKFGLKKIFSSFYKISGWSFKNYNKYISKKLGEELFFKPLFNNGVFCMRSDSIIWEQWKTEYQGALNNAKTNYGIKTDQLSLNKLIYENFKLISILDSTNNWIVSKSEVIIRKNNFFFTPSFPRRKINILHYTNFSSQDSFLCSENNENKKISII